MPIKVFGNKYYSHDEGNKIDRSLFVKKRHTCELFLIIRWVILMKTQTWEINLELKICPIASALENRLVNSKRNE